MFLNAVYTSTDSCWGEKVSVKSLIWTEICSNIVALSNNNNQRNSLMLLSTETSNFIQCTVILMSYLIHFLYNNWGIFKQKVKILSKTIALKKCRPPWAMQIINSILPRFQICKVSKFSFGNLTRRCAHKLIWCVQYCSWIVTFPCMMAATCWLQALETCIQTFEPYSWITSMAPCTVLHTGIQKFSKIHVETRFCILITTNI